MAEAEQPERLRGGREVTVDDVRQLVASATPHFAYQIRNRIRTLIKGLPADAPVRLYAEAEIAKMQSLGFTGEVRGTPEQPGMRAAAERQRDRAAALPEGRHRRLSGWVAARAGSRCERLGRCRAVARAARARAARRSGRTPRRRATCVLTILLAHLLPTRATTARRTLAARAARASAAPHHAPAARGAAAR